MQLTINILGHFSLTRFFPWHFPYISTTFSIIPDSCQNPWHFQIFYTWSPWIVIKNTSTNYSSDKAICEVDDVKSCCGCSCCYCENQIYLDLSCSWTCKLLWLAVVTQLDPSMTKLDDLWPNLLEPTSRRYVCCFNHCQCYCRLFLKSSHSVLLKQQSWNNKMYLIHPCPGSCIHIGGSKCECIGVLPPGEWHWGTGIHKLA